MRGAWRSLYPCTRLDSFVDIINAVGVVVDTTTLGYIR